MKIKSLFLTYSILFISTIGIFAGTDAVTVDHISHKVLNPIITFDSGNTINFNAGAIVTGLPSLSGTNVWTGSNTFSSILNLTSSTLTFPSSATSIGAFTLNSGNNTDITLSAGLTTGSIILNTNSRPVTIYSRTHNFSGSEKEPEWAAYVPNNNCMHLENTAGADFPNSFSAIAFGDGKGTHEQWAAMGLACDPSNPYGIYIESCTTRGFGDHPRDINFIENGAWNSGDPSRIAVFSEKISGIDGSITFNGAPCNSTATFLNVNQGSTPTVSGSTMSTFTGNYPNGHLAILKNTSTSGYDNIRIQDNTSTDRFVFGYGNSFAGGYTNSPFLQWSSASSNAKPLTIGTTGGVYNLSLAGSGDVSIPTGTLSILSKGDIFLEDSDATSSSLITFKNSSGVTQVTQGYYNASNSDSGLLNRYGIKLSSDFCISNISGTSTRESRVFCVAADGSGTTRIGYDSMTGSGSFGKLQYIQPLNTPADYTVCEDGIATAHYGFPAVSSGSVNLVIGTDNSGGKIDFRYNPGLNLTGGTSLATITNSTGDLNIITGNLIISSGGKGLQITGGSNARIATTGAMISGSIAVTNTSLASGDVILPSIHTPSANTGALYISSRTDGSGFTVKSTNILDTSTVDYILVKQN